MVYYISSPGKTLRRTQKKALTGCGSAWLERLVWDQEAAGSNPVTPMYSLLKALYFYYAGVVQW